MRHRLFIFLILFLFDNTFATEYAIDFKAEKDACITHYQIFGERCSGTNFLKCLVLQNLLNDDGPLIFSDEYGHKHYPRWFEQPLEFYNGLEKKYTFQGSENVLFIVIFRNPYDWLRSINKEPFDVAENLKSLPFSKFIRSTWRINKKDKALKPQIDENPYLDCNPEDGAFFDNVMKLRTAKIKTMLEIKNRVNNIYFINYETLRDYPVDVLKEMAHIFNLQLQEHYEPVIYRRGYKKQGVLYKKKEYQAISVEDLDFINTQLDSLVENSIGYSLVDH